MLRVSTGLCWYICDTVAARDIPSQEVPTEEGERHGWPPAHVVTTVSQLEWEVPHHSAVSLRRLIRMLRNSCFVALYKTTQFVSINFKTYRVNDPINTSVEIESAMDTISVVHGARLNVTSSNQIE